MTKKIVAIGGGENGRYLGNGKYREYETEPMDKEIIRLTGKEKPNYLFMVHAQPFNNAIEDGYFETMKKIYGDMFGCSCRNLKSTELDDMEVVNEKIAWADIIYEGGGDTLEMINLWKKTGFDKVLLDAYTDGKVLCGVSAGAVCWFNSCNSDSATSDNDVTFSSVDCLNFIDAYITPHTDENGRYESTKEELKNGMPGEICISGPNVMLEYLDEEEETKNTLEVINGKTYLHTGDIGYIDSKGLVHYKARLKRMIITSGYNVYPANVEDIIMNHEAVTSCAVIGVPEPNKGEIVKAFVTLKEGKNAMLAKVSIQKYLKKHLAKYEQPREIEVLDELPKTKLGKIAYKELEEYNKRA